MSEIEKLTKRAERSEEECARLQVFVNASIPPLRPYTHSFGALFKNGRAEYSGSVVSFENASSVVASYEAQLDAANALLREARHQLAKSVEMFDGYQESDLNHECAHRFFVDGEYGTWETARTLSAKISTYLKDGA